MGYMHIENLYRIQDILLFKECYALEKIDGSSAHILWNQNGVAFFSGQAKHKSFSALFDKDALSKSFMDIFGPEEKVVIYGEGYGGKCQGMYPTYGRDLKFVAFEVQVGPLWLAVPQAEDVVRKFGLEFVHYTKIPTTMEAIDAERDADSVHKQFEMVWVLERYERALYYVP
jgi:hypothetical protein